MVSSQSDRAIVSGLAMLRGFFPASGQEVWLYDEQWQPLPVQIATTDAVSFALLYFWVDGILFSSIA